MRKEEGGRRGKKTIRDARGTGGRRARTSSSGSASALAPAASSRGSGSSERSNESFSTESGDASRGPSRASFLLSAGPGRALPSPRERLGDSGIADTVVAGIAESSSVRCHRVVGADSYIPLGAAANLVLVQEHDIEAGILRMLGRSPEAR